MDEREAVLRLSKGDVDALEPLVQAYQVRAVRAAYLITRDRQQAEEIVQEAFIRSYERIGQLRPGNPYGPWFMRIVANDALKAVTRERRHQSLPGDSDALDAVDGAPDPSSDPESSLLVAETRAEVWAALGEISPEDRSLLVLRYYLEWREAELAEWLDVPIGTVKWRLHEARRHLRAVVAAQDLSESPMARSQARGQQ